MSKFKKGDKVLTPNGEKGKITKINGNYVDVEYLLNDVIEQTFYTHALRFRKTPHERLFDLGFEKVVKHKFVKVNKGGSGYNTPYKITIEFAFNSYQVKCECENWIGVDLELAEILLDYLEEIIK